MKTTPIAAPGSIRPSRRIASIRTTASTAAPAAPSIIGQVEITPVTRKATTMPGSTTWLIASPISACRRSSRKLPGSAQAMAAKMPIRIGVSDRGTNSAPIMPAPPCGPPSRASISAIWSRVSTVSIARQPVIERRRRLEGQIGAHYLPARLVAQRLGGAGAAALGGDAIGAGQPGAAQQAQRQPLVDRLALRQRQQALPQMHPALEAQVPQHRRQHAAPRRQQQRERRKGAKPTSTMIGPVGRSGAEAEIAAPT